jgi:hypothetical protein
LRRRAEFFFFRQTLSIILLTYARITRYDMNEGNKPAGGE